MYTILSFVSGLVFLLVYFWRMRSMGPTVIGVSSTNNLWILWLVLPIAFFILYHYSKEEEKNPLKYATYFMPKFMMALSGVYLVSGLASGVLGSLSRYLLIVGIFLGVVLIFMDLNQAREEPELLQAYVEGKEPEPDDGIVEQDVNPGDFVIGEIYKKNVDEDGETVEGEDEYIPSGKQAVLPLGDRFVHLLTLGVTGTGKTSQALIPMVVQDFSSDDFHYSGIDVVQMGQIILEPKGDFAKKAWAIGKILEGDKRANYINYLLTSEDKIARKMNEMIEQRKRVVDRVKAIPLSKEEARELKDLQRTVRDPEAFRALSSQERTTFQRRLIALETKERGRPMTAEEKGELRLLNDAIKKVGVVQKNLQRVIPIRDYEELTQLTTHAMFKYSSYISDITLNPNDADVTWEEVKAVDPDLERDIFMLFDPSSPNSPYFNPLFGPEDTAVGTVTSTLISFMEDSSEYFKNLSSAVVQRAIRIAKRVHGDDATLIHVDDILTDNGGRGEDMIMQLLRMDASPEQQASNKDITDYFINNYYPGMKGGRGATRDFEQSSGVRNILSNLLDNEQVRHVLNPPKGIGTEIDFDDILKTGDKVALSTATDASDAVGRMLGSFLILQLQEAIFRRKGKEGQRVPVVLYIDEFQDYASSSFEKVLTQGRSYVVSATMATQTLGIVEQQAGKGLVSNLQSNARNVIVFPGGSASDAKYFVSLFGDVERREVNRSISQAVEEEPTGMSRFFSQLSGGDHDDGPVRESVSERVTQVERFTESHVMFGPNYKNKGIGGNISFTYIYYRIVVNNSIQVPAVARIQWIDKALNDRADEIIEAYDSVLIAGGDPQSVVEDSGVDLLEKEADFKQSQRRPKESTDVVTDDPRTQARRRDGSVVKRESAKRRRPRRRPRPDLQEGNRRPRPRPEEERRRKPRPESGKRKPRPRPDQEQPRRRKRSQEPAKRKRPVRDDKGVAKKNTTPTIETLEEVKLPPVEPDKKKATEDVKKDVLVSDEVVESPEVVSEESTEGLVDESAKEPDKSSDDTTLSVEDLVDMDDLPTADILNEVEEVPDISDFAPEDEFDLSDLDDLLL